jgi:hypothetical protein
MPTGPSSSSYIIPPLTLSDTFYEWYKLTNDEIIDKLNRLKVYTTAGSTGIETLQGDDGIATIYIAPVIPGDHTFTGNITFDGSVTTVNTNFLTVDDYNIVLGAVGTGGSNTGGTSDDKITQEGGGGIVIAGACGNKYFLWKAYEGVGRTYSAWRISDSLAFSGDAKFYSNNNSFSFVEGDDSTPASSMTIKTYSSGSTIDVQTYFDISGGTTYTNAVYLRDGSSRLIDSSLIKRFSSISNITSIGITFGSSVRHDVSSGGLTLAQANNVSNAESLGVVVGFSIPSQTVDVCLLGYVGGTFSGSIASADATTVLGTGEFYFLSDSEAGKITKNAPTLTNTVRKPLLYALGSNKAMVMNYVGNKIVDIDSIYSKINSSTVIINHTDGYFSIGDVVRFEEGITSSSRPHGSYVKASSASPEESEALGVISKINYGGSGSSSLMTVSGFIDLSGMTGSTLSPGMVYYLGIDPGRLTETPPASIGTVRKPILVAVSPNTGIVQNYVGLVVGTDTSSSGTTTVSNGAARTTNKLINGNFDVWQRGTTFGYRSVTTELDRYCADRWKVVNSGALASDRLSMQVNQIALSLGDLEGSNVYSKYALEFDIGTGGYTSDSETYLFQRVEGIEHLPRGYATVSFYAKSTVSNSRLGVSFRRDFGGGTAPDYLTTGVTNSQYVPGFVITPPTYWKKFTYTFALPDCDGGVIGNLQNDGPELRFHLRAGTTFAGKSVSEAINPNIAGVNNYKIQIAQVQFEEGLAANPFVELDPQSEFTKCLRYYQTTSSVIPFRQLTASSVTGPDSIMAIGLGLNSFITPRYPVEIRNPSSSSISIADQTASPPSSNFSILQRGSKGFRAQRIAGSPGNLEYQYQVESEL